MTANIEVDDLLEVRGPLTEGTRKLLLSGESVLARCVEIQPTNYQTWCRVVGVFTVYSKTSPFGATEIEEVWVPIDRVVKVGGCRADFFDGGNTC